MKEWDRYSIREWDDSRWLVTILNFEDGWVTIRYDWDGLCHAIPIEVFQSMDPIPARTQALN